MKNIIFIYILLLCVYTSAQTLYTDEKGVKVFYEIQQTEKYVLCEGNSYSNENLSNKKIYLWKVTFGIENGYSGSIVPRGVGIATISVSPDPIKPYSHNYCDYKYLKNYEPNAVQRHLDQSLFIWAIKGHKVEEIRPEEIIKATTYLYLYEGQTPKLTNWQFLGYRLKKDFTSYDPILNDIVKEPKSSVYLDKHTNDKVESVKIKYNDEVSPIKTSSAKIDEISIKTTKIVTSDVIPIKEKKVVNDNKKETNKDKITVKEIEAVTNKAVDKSLKATKVIPVKEINVTKDVKNKADNVVAVVKQIEPANNETVNIPVKCPGKKALEYKEMSSNASDIDAQKAYSWLALYYTYKCECEMGSPRSDQLVPMINNIVDSYITNTNDAFGKISKVTKCKAPNLK